MFSQDIADLWDIILSTFAEQMNMEQQQRLKLKKKERLPRRFAIITSRFIEIFMSGLIAISISSEEPQLRSRLK